MAPALKLLTTCAATLAIASCDQNDSVFIDSNSDGINLDITEISDDGRMVCIFEGDKVCRESVAQVVIRDISGPEQLVAEWKDEHVVGVYVRGGRVERCRHAAAGNKIKVELYRIPNDAARLKIMPSAQEAKNSAIKDSCGI